MAPNGERQFNCSWEQCEKSFDRKSDLCRHYRIHTNERPYYCIVNDCGKRFIQRSALTIHLRTHTGEKSHVCDYESCHKAFSDSSSLARHRRIHTGKRPYPSVISNNYRRFCRKTTLTRHQRHTHPPVSMKLQRSKDATLETSYQSPVPALMPNDQYLLAPQPSYPHIPSQSLGFYPQNLPISHAITPEALPAIQQDIELDSVACVQAAKYMQLMQPYERSRLAFEFLEHRQQPLAGHCMVDTQHLSVSNSAFR